MPLLDMLGAAGAYDVNPIAVNVACASGAETKLLEFVLPARTRGVLRAFGFQCPAAGLATLILQLKVDDSPCPNFPNGILANVAGMRPDELEEVYRELGPSQRVSITAKQSSGGSLNLDARMKILLAPSEG